MYSMAVFLIEPDEDGNQVSTDYGRLRELLDLASGGSNVAAFVIFDEDGQPFLKASWTTNAEWVVNCDWSYDAAIRFASFLDGNLSLDDVADIDYDFGVCQ